MLCQFNVAWMKVPYDDPLWDSWKENLVPKLHARAATYPGFVKIYDGPRHPLGHVAAYGDPLLMGNLSAWEDPVDLRRFVFDDPAHFAAMKATARWFNPPRWEPFSVYYWSDKLELDEAQTMLTQLRDLGSCDRYFTLKELLAW